MRSGLANNFIPASTNPAKRLDNYLRLNPFRISDLNQFLVENACDGIVLLTGCSKLAYCEQEPHISYSVNVELPCQIARLASDHDLPVVFFSTEYLYNGSFNFPKTESDKNLLKLSNYSKQKHAMEELVMSLNPCSTILRIPKIYNHFYPGNLLGDLLEVFKTNKRLLVAKDQVLSPLSSEDLSNILTQVIKKKLFGIFNCGGPEHMSRFRFAQIVSSFVSNDVELEPVKLSDVVDCSLIPLNTCMDSSRLSQLLKYSSCSINDYMIKFNFGD